MSVAYAAKRKRSVTWLKAAGRICQELVDHSHFNNLVRSKADGTDSFKRAFMEVMACARVALAVCLHVCSAMKLNGTQISTLLVCIDAYTAHIFK